MAKSKLKRGKIEIIGEDTVTILNLDGPCRDTLRVTPEEAIRVRDEIGFGETVLYFSEGTRLVQVDTEREAPELRDLYRALPKTVECVTA